MTRADILKINWDIARARVDQLESQVRDLTQRNAIFVAKELVHIRAVEDLMKEVRDLNRRTAEKAEKIKRYLHHQ